MKKKIIFVSLALLAIPAVYWFYSKHKLKSEVEPFLRDLKNENWEKRDEALNAILAKNLLKEKIVSDTLLQLLGEENKKDEKIAKNFETTGELDAPGEGYGEYNINLIDAVTRLTSKETIPLLVDAIEYGPAVAEALAKFGDASVSLLLEKCRNGDDEERWSCLRALRRFYQQTVSPETKYSIKMAVTNATKDKSEWVRENAEEIIKEMGW